MHQEAAAEFKFNTPVFYLQKRQIKGAESNVSRLARLCWKYNIPPSLLFNEFLKDGTNVNRSFFNFEVASHLNSYTDKTVILDDKLNRLLGVKQNAHHSYRYLNGILDQRAHGFLSENKKWCATCYRERQQDTRDSFENGVFDDLYWSVDAIRICMLHGTALRNKCANCFSKQPYLSTTVEPGYCHTCHSFLGDGEAASVDEEELSRQQTLFYLFYICTYDEFRPEMARLIHNLQALREAYPSATSRYLGELIGVSEDVVRKWIGGSRKPRLDSLFRLQVALGLSGIHQLFLPDTEFIARIMMSKNLALNFNARSRFKDIKKEQEIKEFMLAMIEGEEETMSRENLAKKFGVSVGYLKSRYMRECEHLSRVHKHRMILEKEQRDADFAVQLDRALSMVASRKKKWTIENTLAEMPAGAANGIDFQELFITFGKAKERLLERRRKKKS